MIKSYKTRFQKFSALLSDPEIAKYARQNGNHAFSRKRKNAPKRHVAMLSFKKRGLPRHLNLETISKKKETCLCSYLSRDIYNRENV